LFLVLLGLEGGGLGGLPLFRENLDLSLQILEVVLDQVLVVYREPLQVRLECEKGEISIDVAHHFLKEELDFAHNALFFDEEQLAKLLLKGFDGLLVESVGSGGLELELLLHLLNLLFEPFGAINLANCFERNGMVVEVLVVEALLAAGRVAVQAEVV